MNAQFEHLGYFKEYYLDNKFLGSINIDQLDRDVVGYCGRRAETLDQPLTIKKGLVLKPGVVYHTIVYPLCGRFINK